jgi:UDP-glucose 4-epimerase
MSAAAVLVTGGAGFIGSHVCAALCAAGRSVVVLDDLSTGNEANLAGLPVRWVRGSVTDPAAVAAAMQGVRGVVHLAALPSVARSLERPLDTHHACATGTAVVLHAASQQRARVVYAGSSSAYGNQDVLQKHEALREDPLSPYAAAKLAGELYCRSFARVYGLEVVVTRFFNVFGPRQPADSPYSGVVAAFCRAMLAGKPVRIDGDGGQARDFTYVEDVVAGVLACLDGRSVGCRTVNLAYGQSTTVLELHRCRLPCSRRRGPGTFVTRWPTPRPRKPNSVSLRGSVSPKDCSARSRGTGNKPAGAARHERCRPRRWPR